MLGLLPTPEETDAFLRDESPDAWDQLINRILSSPHYGERWGRHWLDHARYADSNGYTIDGKREAWPWRVIHAFNSDMPFDRFTVEQLAGDLLATPSTSQLVATGFHRNTMINEEGGVKPDQYRNEAIVDRVNTTGSVWLGLTIGCAQCHSHKFDPVTHEEYYRLYAFFNGASDANNAGDTVPVYRDEMFGFSPQQQQIRDNLRQLEEQLKALEDASKTDASLATIDWKWQAAEVRSAISESNFRFIRRPDNAFLASMSFAENDAYQIDIVPPAVAAEGVRRLTAFRIRVLPDPSLPMNGPGLADNGNFLLSEIELKVDGAVVPFQIAGADHSQPGYPVADAIDGNKDTGWAINVDADQASRGIRMNVAHEAIFVVPAGVSFTDQPVTLVMKHALNKMYLVGCFSVEVSSMPLPESLSNRTTAQNAGKTLSDLKAQVELLRESLPGKGIPTLQMIVREMSQPPATYLLKRGDFLAPDRERGPLSPGVPAALGQLSPDTAPTGRLQLASWIASRDNPLTARVYVNRVWQRHFGRGLVETDNDFGYQGTPPSHPELLDWLAAEWMDRGWSMKELHRIILQSATWQQDSSVTPAYAAVDPDNRLLGHQQRFRVEAEIVRDQLLSASRLLQPTIGGPGFFPPQPEGVYDFTQHKKEWPVSTGPDRYRRTMYTTFFRSAPYPLLSTFDSPDFSTACTQRVRSNTPLQALTLANDSVMLEMAVGLADHLMTQNLGPEAVKNGRLPMSDEEFCRTMFRCCLTRTPSSDEVQTLLEFYSRELSRFTDAPDQAPAFVSCFSHQQTSDRIPQLAAWGSVARVLVNTDEFVMRN